VSDSILYLAIVAIWAGFLIPAWVRRPHKQETEAESASASASASASESESAEPGTGFEAEAPVAARAGGPEETTEYLADSEDDVAVDRAAHVHVEVQQAVSEYRDDVHADNYDSAGPLEAPTGPPDYRPSQSREQMMRARRRMLTILIGLTLVTGLFVMAGVVQWWIVVPPVIMLVLYVMLLREIAMAEAELAGKRRAWEARQAAAARARAAHATGWQRSHQVWEDEAPEPTAEIIDISGRVGDQLYDQYADAAVRAVGD
jgi:hypothetical protein